MLLSFLAKKKTNVFANQFWCHHMTVINITSSESLLIHQITEMSRQQHFKLSTLKQAQKHQQTPKFSGWGWNISCHFRRLNYTSDNPRSVQTHFIRVNKFVLPSCRGLNRNIAALRSFIQTKRLVSHRACPAAQLSESPELLFCT